MTCYHPLIRAEHRWKKEIAKDGHFYPKANIFSPNNYNKIENLQDNEEYTYTLIPCGKCIGCRLEYSRQWANRGYLEAKKWENNYFVTLTYNEENLPKLEEITTSEGITYTDQGEWKGTLVPKHLTAFIKKIRQEMKRKYNQDNIRFMACGEYGEEGERPHYHIIFFNLNLPLGDLHGAKISWNKDIYYQSKIIEKCWGKGHHVITEANWNTIAYTARYVTKKINGEIKEDYYAEKGQEPEFFRVSRRPGIAKNYYDENKEKILKYNEIIVNNSNGTIATAPPNYYKRLFKEEFEKEFKELQEKNKKIAIDNGHIKDTQTSLERKEQLELEEKRKYEKTDLLKRGYEINKL